MARKEADLTTFTMASDYDPAHYKNWTEKELSALGDCKATGEVIKKRLEDHGAKVKEMHVIEHKGEKKADSKSKEYHNSTDSTKTHYQILVKFEPSHGATLEEIAEYIGVPMEVIVKPKPGRYSYSNNLAYLIHIKYKNKIQYAPEAVVTLAGTDYMDYFNGYKASWDKARDIVAKKGGKPLDRLCREAITKLESGELSYKELAGIPEYRNLLAKEKYQPKLATARKRIEELAEFDRSCLLDKIRDGEISKEEAKTREEYKLVFKYYSDAYINKSIQ